MKMLPLPSYNVAIADGKGLPSTAFYTWLKSLSQFIGGTGGGGPPPPVVDLRLGVNIIDHGGDNSGVADNSTALANSFAALGGTGGTIYFPAGRYKFTAAVTITLPAANALYNLSLVGDGADASTLVWTSGGLTINFVGTNVGHNNQSFHARDLSITTTQVGVSNGLRLTQTAFNNGNYAALTELNRVAIKGDGGYGSASGNYWSNALIATGISNVNLYGCYFEGSGAARLGNGFSALGLNGSNVAVVINVVGCSFNLLNVGFSFGDDLQGVTFDSCNFDCKTGIVNQAGLSAVDSQLAVTNCQFGINATGNGIFIGTALSATMIVNNLFLQNFAGSVITTGGIDITAVVNTIIQGNVFQTPVLQANSIGVSLSGAPANSGAIVSHNLFSGFDGSGSLPISVASSAKDCIISNNSLIVCNDISNLGNPGTTFASQLNNNSGDFAFRIGNQHGSATDHGIAIPSGANSTTDSTTVILAFANGNSTATVGSITRSGTGVAYNVTSDGRLKTRLGIASCGLELARKIEVVDFTHNDDPRTVRQGFIAQDLHRVYPDAVHVGGDDPLRRPWGVDNGSLVPLLTRAVQQLADRIEKLEARLDNVMLASK